MVVGYLDIFVFKELGFSVGPVVDDIISLLQIYKNNIGIWFYVRRNAKIRLRCRYASADKIIMFDI